MFHPVGEFTVLDSCIAMCAIIVSGAAPCQVRRADPHHIACESQELARRKSARGRSLRSHTAVWPRGWVCHAVRAGRERHARGVEMRGRRRLENRILKHGAVKQGTGARLVGTLPEGMTFMANSSLTTRTSPEGYVQSNTLSWRRKAQNKGRHANVTPYGAEKWGLSGLLDRLRVPSCRRCGAGRIHTSVTSTGTARLRQSAASAFDRLSTSEKRRPSVA